MKNISPKPTKFLCFPPQKINRKRVSRVVAVANSDDAIKSSGDVTQPTKPVGDNEVVKALKTVGWFVFDSVKAVCKIVITQIVTIVTTALFKEDVTKDKLKVILMV